MATKKVENDNDADTGTNVGRVKGEFLFSYFVRWVYVFRYPAARSHPCKFTNKILALSAVETLFFRVATQPHLGTFNVVA